jgi:hypothetical protein
MKRAALFAAGAALAASTVIATPSFAVKSTDPCTTLQNQLNQLEVKLAHQGIDTRRGSNTLGKIIALKETARFIHCHLH